MRTVIAFAIFNEINQNHYHVVFEAI